MLSDFVTEAKNVKFVDDSTLVTIGRKNLKSDSMQRATDQTAKWSKEIKLGINSTKTKEILIIFGQDNSLPFIDHNGGFIERVNQSKLLGVIISSDLKWDAHVHYINSKATKRIHYLRELKRSGLSQSHLPHMYLALVRSVFEYACQVWSTGLTKELCQTLESIQKRAFKIVVPKESYQNACLTLRIPTLKERRESLCKSPFNAMKDPSHRLHHMIPVKRNLGNISYSKYELPKCKIIIIIMMNLYRAGSISQNAHRCCNVCVVMFL